jgi:antirestriction protein ArdC
MDAAFHCASLGIFPAMRQADYIGSWFDVLREGNRAVVCATSRASKAADRILDFLPGVESRTGLAATPTEEAA